MVGEKVLKKEYWRDMLLELQGLKRKLPYHERLLSSFLKCTFVNHHASSYEAAAMFLLPFLVACRFLFFKRGKLKMSRRYMPFGGRKRASSRLLPLRLLVIKNVLEM